MEQVALSSPTPTDPPVELLLPFLVLRSGNRTFQHSETTYISQIFSSTSKCKLSVTTQATVKVVIISVDAIQHQIKWPNNETCITKCN